MSFNAVKTVIGVPIHYVSRTLAINKNDTTQIYRDSGSGYASITLPSYSGGGVLGEPVRRTSTNELMLPIIKDSGETPSFFYSVNDGVTWTLVDFDGDIPGKLCPRGTYAHSQYVLLESLYPDGSPSDRVFVSIASGGTGWFTRTLSVSAIWKGITGNGTVTVIYGDDVVETSTDNFSSVETEVAVQGTPGGPVIGSGDIATVTPDLPGGLVFIAGVPRTLLATGAVLEAAMAPRIFTADAPVMEMAFPPSPFTLSVGVMESTGGIAMATTSGLTEKLAQKMTVEA